MLTEECNYFIPLSVGGVRVGTLGREYGPVGNVHRSGLVRQIGVVGAVIAADEPGAVGIVRNTARLVRTTDVETRVVRDSTVLGRACAWVRFSWNDRSQRSTR